MDISLPALVSILALVILVGISCVNEDLNVGFLGIAFGIIVGGVFAGTPASKVMNAFPLSLFMILVGVTFLFGMAQTNGTMEKLTAYSIRACKGNTALVPIIIYILATFITTIGPGNIAGCALMAPVAMAIASKVKMPAFLMTLLVVGACNGAAFSPFAPTGIISNGIIAKCAPELGIPADYLNTLAWKIHFNSTIAQGFVNIGGFFVMGGLKWIREQKGAALDIDELAPKPEPFNAAQTTTLLLVAILIILVVVPGLPGVKGTLPKTITNMLSNVGSISFVLSIVLMLTGYGDSKAAVKVMPWSVIMMVCGVSVLIDVMDKAGGLNFLVEVMASVAGPTTICFWTAFVPAVISAYSSSSGVVMPMFLPMTPGLVELTGGDPIAIISAIDVGSHLVDTSPLSTLGALCIASAGEEEDKGVLFRKLLIWGLSMSIVSGIVCYVFFGLLGF
ncbi:SLC13 family permease [Phascolarctobacterium sp. ET69]|jgi:di/tricarboxylate transporter|uniref:SLC13 family permease n=1 Tax=Phascolarctobacterium sp. ET69 TaxID=2939420 RepID=UPI0020122EB1|nr:MULTISPECIES: SLC13 family permease [Phascolarctobacterium]MCL1605863.1 SLC13 family permease [Phascolarctobacterium sp. ET69]MDM8109342.1 SLC13 family permease [Phascolarctobacterium faecium]